MFGFQKRLQGNGLLNGVLPRLSPPQGGHAAEAAQLFADVLAERTDIGALGAADPELRFPAVKAKQLQFVDGDGPGLPFHLFALPGKIAELPAVDLQGGIHGGNLHDLSPEFRKNIQNILLCKPHRPLFQHRAGNVLSIGSAPEAEGCLIGLLRMLEKLHSPGGPAHKHRQNAGSHGIQSASMANAPGRKYPAQSGGHILAGPALGLVHNNDAVHGQTSSMACSTVSTACAMGRRRLAPAAPLWPPPPNFSAIRVAS